MTDKLSGELHSFLVKLAYSPEETSHETVHKMEHILRLLEPKNEEAVVHYYGLFGKERMSLKDIARSRGISEESMMAVIDGCVRRLAVTPEWQVVKNNI